MNRIDKKRNKERETIQPIAKELTDMVRKISPPTEDFYPMMEGELTKAQLECKEPVGTKGYYRMYRWECMECSEVGRKMPYFEMQTDFIKHYEKTGHKGKERGGVFPRGDLYT